MKISDHTLRKLISEELDIIISESTSGAGPALYGLLQVLEIASPFPFTEKGWKEEVGKTAPTR